VVQSISNFISIGFNRGYIDTSLATPDMNAFLRG
jgi:hypothetical protein